MKRIIIIAVLVFNMINILNAQNKEPEKMVFQGPSSTFVFDINDIKYQQKDFMLGWQ